MKIPTSADVSVVRWLIFGLKSAFWSATWSRPSTDGDAREELVDSAQIAAKIPEVVETIPQERIWCIFEEVDDFTVPQFVEENLEVIKAVPPSFPSFRQKLLR